MFREGTRQQGGNGIANLPDLLLKIAGNNKRIIKTLEAGSFANGYAAMIARMDKMSGAGIGKVGRDGLRDAMTMRTPKSIADC